MVTLKKILPAQWAQSLSDHFLNFEIAAIRCDSREVKPNDVFVALKGQQVDGANYIDEAISRGARVIICSEAVNHAVTPEYCVIVVPEPSHVLTEMTLRYYDYPSQKISCIGVTGTNGKTTITYLIEHILKIAAMKTAVMGTIDCHFEDQTFTTKNTTPGFLETQTLLNQFVKRDAQYCVMEVSSHALDQARVEAINFKAAVFTNLTKDHLDYHHSMEEYFLAKQKLFTSLPDQAFAVINLDDAYGQRLIKSSKGRVLTYSVKDRADFCATDISLNIDATAFVLECLDQKTKITTRLIGRHNIYNILAAVGVCVALGVELSDVIQAIETFSGVKGRLQRVDCDQSFSIFIDYAHTPDALENVLSLLKETTHHKLILVFGCGGNRDKSKRAEMGKIAGELADFTVITSDNPRDEDPVQIMKEVAAGMVSENFLQIVERKEAIEKALSMANPSDVVLIAGKGHETYQVIGGENIPFNEYQIIKDFLNADD